LDEVLLDIAITSANTKLLSYFQNLVSAIFLLALKKQKPAAKKRAGFGHTVNAATRLS